MGCWERSKETPDQVANGGDESNLGMKFEAGAQKHIRRVQSGKALK